MELYGKWQTEKYNPGEVIDGNLPKNEFGNIELYKSWMLPKGAVHIFRNFLFKSEKCRQNC